MLLTKIAYIFLLIHTGILVSIQPGFAHPGEISKPNSTDYDHLLIAKKTNQPVNLKERKKLTSSTVHIDIEAPREFVWSMLTDFNHYPEFFKRIRSCKITKTDGNLVLTESQLRSHFFMKDVNQHIVNDLSAKPNLLKWRMLDGSFKAAQGAWQLSSADDGRRCRLTYTLEVDTGSAIPGPLISFVVKMIQREIISSIKSVTESAYRSQYQPSISS